MSLFSISSLARLDVKWTNIHQDDALFYQTPHANPYYQLILVVDGPVYLQVDEEKLTLQSGEYMLLTPWQQHMGWKEARESSFFWVQFSSNPPVSRLEEDKSIVNGITLIGSGSDLRSMNSNEVWLVLPRRARPACRFELALAFERMIAVMRKPSGYFRVRLSLMIWTILELIANDYLESNHLDPSTPESFILYRKIVNILDERYQQEIAPDLLESGVSRTYGHICSVFKKYSGMTITSYVHVLRIQRAKYLLQTTAHTVASIANEVGYVDPYYFSKLFKKMTGVTPLQFRQHQA